MSKKLVASLVALLIIVITVVAAVFLIRQRQDITGVADQETVTPTVSISPKEATVDPGKSQNVTLSFNTGGAIVSSVSVRVTYPYIGQAPKVVASDLAVSSQFGTSADWTCPVQQIRESASVVQIDVACVNSSTAGYSTNVEVPLASFTLTANEVPATNPVVLSFDTTKTNLTVKSTSEKLDFSTSTGSYTIGKLDVGGGLDLLTPAPSSSASGSPTATPLSLRTSSPRSTSSATPVALPDSGVGEVFVLASSVGLILILGAVLLVW